MPRTESATATPHLYDRRFGRHRLRIVDPTPAPVPERGLTLLVDDGDPTLAYSGYRLYVEHDRYIIRIWHRLLFRELVQIYKATLTGEPEKLLLAAFRLRCLGDLPNHGGGPWGSGDQQVYQECTAPLIHAGFLLPAP